VVLILKGADEFEDPVGSLEDEHHVEGLVERVQLVRFFSRGLVSRRWLNRRLVVHADRLPMGVETPEPGPW